MFIAALFTVAKIWEQPHPLTYDRWVDQGDVVHTYNGLKVKVLLAQSCLCDPTDCSPPGSSVHGILQARILEWVAISYPRGSFRLRDRTRVSYTVGSFFNIWASREAYMMEYYSDIFFKKRKEIIPLATTWVDLKIIILSKVSQTEKHKCHMISLICGI